MTDAAENIRRELLEKLIEVSSFERIHQILSGTSERERRRALKVLAKHVSMTVMYVFRSKVPIRKGPLTKYAERDRQIVKMRAEGKTYGKIAKEMKMNRTAVPAAINRYWKPLDDIWS